MAALGWRRRRESSPAARRGARQRAGLVCQAWTLDRRCKSSAERVGSNRKPKATARRRERRETIRLGAARPCGKEAGRRAAAPNESEASYRPGRSGERAKERDAQNPTEIGAVLRTGAAVHPVSLPWEVCMGPRKR